MPNMEDMMFDALGELYDDNAWRTTVNDLRIMHRDFQANGVRANVPTGLGTQPTPIQQPPTPAPEADDGAPTLPPETPQEAPEPPRIDQPGASVPPPPPSGNVPPQDSEGQE